MSINFKYFKLIFASLLISSNIYASLSIKDKLVSYVDNLVNISFSLLDNNELSLNSKIKKAQISLKNNLDLNKMSLRALGRNKYNVNPNYIEEYQKAYEKYVINTYSQSISLYRGQKFSVIGVHEIDKNEYIVKAEITNQNTKYSMDFVVYAINDIFKVNDIITEGVSLIETQKSEFSSILSNQGIKHLIEKLNQLSK